MEGTELPGDEGIMSGTKLFASRTNDEDVKRTPIAAAVIVKKADPRLARLAKADVKEARGEGRLRHRRGAAYPLFKLPHVGSEADQRTISLVILLPL
jgi:hypothetical protein